MHWHDWIAGGQHLALGSERIFYRVDGNDTDAHAPTLLFAHGFPTSSHDFAPVVARLSGRYRCVSFDFLGFGASSKPHRRYGYALQHEVLARVVAAAKVTRATLIVHDYAVTLGQDFLAESPRAPFALAGIVFLNGALDPTLHRARPIQRFLASRVGGVVGPRLLRRGSVLRAFRKIIVRQEAVDDDDVWAAVSHEGGLAITPRLLHYIADRPPRRDALVAALGAGTTPRAFVWGVDDPVSGRHVLDAVRPHVRDGSFHELGGVGHYPQLEAPDDVARVIDVCATSWGRAEGIGARDGRSSS